MAVVAKNGCFLEQSDVKKAFLNADNVGEDYVRLPKCVVAEGESAIRRLQKALYGLRRAPNLCLEYYIHGVGSVSRFQAARV